MREEGLGEGRAAARGDEDSDGSLSWEDFFGSSSSADLVPSLLGMYDALIGRSGGQRPLSVASSSSSSSSSSSADAGRRGRRSQSSAYLASVESLGDDELSLCEEGGIGGGGERRRRRAPDEEALAVRGTRAQHRHQSGRRAASAVATAAACKHISPPAPPSGPRPRYCDPNLSYMDRVVMEIAETEAIYVRDLQQVIEGYLHRWRSSEDCSIGSKQLMDLFGNIEDIYMFNSEFLCQLEQCGLDPVKVARTFVKNNAGFSIYTDYCTNYPRTVSVLTELMRQDSTVRLFRERQGALQHTLPLGSYLLKPVQRILKYHLLLQNIVKHFGKESEGYRDIADALSAMTGIAHHINEMKRRHEHAIRVQEIQSLLYGWEGEDLTTYGELCAEGAFQMHGAKALRHAFLFDRMLLLSKRKEEGMLIYKAHILCSNLMLIESIPGEPLSFHVIPFDNPRLQYTLQARNLEQKREWTLQLKRVILENYNAVIPTHARQLVMELGQNRTDDEILAEKSTPKRQHSAPEYLERRKQERRKSETGLLLRTRLRRSNRKTSNVGTMDGASSKEPSPAVHRRGRRTQSQDRSNSSSRSQLGGELLGEEEAILSASEKVKDRFGSWRRKSEPGYLSKSAISTGHFSIYVSPDFIERSTDSLCDEPSKDVISISQGDSHNFQMLEGDSNDDNSVKIDDLEGDYCPGSLHDFGKEKQSAKEDMEDVHQEKSLEEIVGQLVMQSHQFQRILMRQHRRMQGGGANRSRHNSREHSRHGSGANDEPRQGVSCAGHQPAPLAPCSPGDEHPARVRLPPANAFRMQREAHMCALRQEQRLSTVVQNRSMQEGQPSQSDTQESVSLCFDGGISAGVTPMNESGLGDPFSVGCNPAYRCTSNYDNLQSLWERVLPSGKEVTPSPESTCCVGQDPPSPWSSRGLEPCLPTLPAVWLKQQEDHLATPSLKSGSLPRGFQWGHSPQALPLSHGHSSALESNSPGTPADSVGNDDEGYPSHLLRMERPFTIASESPGRADEIDFEDIEHYMAETGRSGSGVSSFLSPRFPLPPLSDVEGRLEGMEDEEDDDEEEDNSASHLNVHPDYRIYRPSVTRATLKNVICSLSSKLANLRASSGGMTTEDEEDGSEGVGGGEGRGSNRRKRSRLKVGSSCPSSLDSDHVYRGGGHLSGSLLSGESEPETGKGGGSWLVYTLARHYSRSLKERIRSIMTMNIMGTSNNNVNHDPTEGFRGAEQDGLTSDLLNSQDNLNQAIIHSSPTKGTTPPPVTYHKQGSSGLGARIAHGGDVPEYATPHVCGIRGKGMKMKDISSRPDSLLSATSSALTSSSDGDNKTLSCPGDTSATNSEIFNAPTCNIIINADEDDDYGGVGSGDSYYERSFEAIESFLSDPSMGCSAVGDTFRDSAIFSDHEEVDEVVGRVSNPVKNNVTNSQARISRSTSLCSKIPPPVPAKPRATSIAVATTGAMPSTAFSLDFRLPSSAPTSSSSAATTHQEPSQPPLPLLGVKSVRERRQELEMRRSNVNVSSGCCDWEGGRRAQRDSLEKVANGNNCAPKSVDSMGSEATEGGSTPKGWVRHVIGKLQGD